MSRDSTSLAWLTPVFELYCIAGPHASRNALAQSANKIVQWLRREEERLFIIGGAVSSPFILACGRKEAHSQFRFSRKIAAEEVLSPTQ